LLRFGFKQIVENPRPSILTLIQKAGFKVENINTSNVVFCLGPRINAVGRLGDATRAVEFLTCNDVSKVDALASVLELENINRKKIDNEIYVQAQNIYEQYKNIESGKDDVAIVLHNPEWHPGVLGIIASRMVEKYYRPAIIMTTFNGMAKGSARSINHFNIYDALKQCASEFSGLVQFGGHYHAAGLEVELDKINEFRTCFNKVAKNIIELSDSGWDILVPELKIDAELNFNEINRRFVKILKHFEPFGPSNMTPVFKTGNVQVVGEPRIFNNSTYVFKVRRVLDESSVGLHKSPAHEQNVFDCVYYRANLSNDTDNFQIRTGSHLDIVYSVEENHWNDKTKTQFRIRDLKIL
jgi:single-stranded-DNA-specific exonuclease